MKQTIIPSPQTQQEAQAIAKASQKPGQTKEQTKLIAQGIEKGIALYKKQQKEKSRQADRAKKKSQQLRHTAENTTKEVMPLPAKPSAKSIPWLPWGLLIISWMGFIIYLSTKTS
ncbi:DUF2956 domain-containing protein [Vibrio metschnikovii]|uniref:DUF2956 domain-containing protein n=4 Tax=Unclassified Bacteria TaxID=49928 RepID=A0AAU6SVK4_UNCXX|nr:DUF2956 domain-containing protein [Vibrio metschnikovii]EKO3557281.1 DUF2956 domain-containing protein [Vibrio metschnikovii]EKO3568968.1 DUF2956 domain-containing protein [Vibrio metschnikovii]EKO3574824.1 DUF2956 domain-containing protein [Vibrio metschnikovii]EKO3578999.1 DUF2956 domain-containing protein [Vibrio metschnikovii]EKO3580986.1 DUF2956 domain-containing protein [Vibrio metschnikovii]